MQGKAHFFADTCFSWYPIGAFLNAADKLGFHAIATIADSAYFPNFSITVYNYANDHPVQTSGRFIGKYHG